MNRKKDDRMSKNKSMEVNLSPVSNVHSIKQTKLKNETAEDLSPETARGGSRPELRGPTNERNDNKSTAVP
jgi:hypothetical protein